MMDRRLVSPQRVGRLGLLWLPSAISEGPGPFQATPGMYQVRLRLDSKCTIALSLGRKPIIKPASGREASIQEKVVCGSDNLLMARLGFVRRPLDARRVLGDRGLVFAPGCRREPRRGALPHRALHVCTFGSAGL